MMGPNLYNDTCMIPLPGFVSCLVLDGDTVPWPEGRKRLASLGNLFSFLNVTLCIRCGPGLGCLSPFRSWLEFARLKGKEITEYPTIDNLGW